MCKLYMSKVNPTVSEHSTYTNNVLQSIKITTKEIISFKPETWHRFSADKLLNTINTKLSLSWSSCEKWSADQLHHPYVCFSQTDR